MSRPVGADIRAHASGNGRNRIYGLSASGRRRFGKGARGKKEERACAHSASAANLRVEEPQNMTSKLDNLVSVESAASAHGRFVAFSLRHNRRHRLSLGSTSRFREAGSVAGDSQGCESEDGIGRRGVAFRSSASGGLYRNPQNRIPRSGIGPRNVPGRFPRSGIARRSVPGRFPRSGIARRSVPGRFPRSGIVRRSVPGRFPKSGNARRSLPGCFSAPGHLSQ